jgi:dienelactone hydrolase
MMMKTLQITFLFTMAFSMIHAQGNKEKITFMSEDGLEITADQYLENPEYPYILLFHQAGSSRGEFNGIAERFGKLRYNCLAVDLRSGGTSNFIRNETAEKAGGKNARVKFLDALPDIQAAISYAYNLNPKEVILLGSSYSASLILLEGEKNDSVKAMIAFSPGEYFGETLRMQDTLDSISKPCFIAVTQREEPYVREMMSNVPQEEYTLFKPEKKGVHGARALREDNSSKDEYWLALLMFLHNLNK